MIWIVRIFEPISWRVAAESPQIICFSDKEELLHWIEMQKETYRSLKQLEHDFPNPPYWMEEVLKEQGVIRVLKRGALSPKLAEYPSDSWDEAKEYFGMGCKECHFIYNLSDLEYFLKTRKREFCRLESVIQKEIERYAREMKQYGESTE